MAKPFLPETLNKIDKFSALWPEKEKKKRIQQIAMLDYFLHNNFLAF